MKPRLATLDPRRLRRWLGLIFVAVAVPSGLLVHHAWGQLKWEAFHLQRQRAESFAAAADMRFVERLAVEEGRAVTDYAFLVAGDGSGRFLQRSPLAAFPPAGALPGLLGHFQIDADGRFSSPLLPADGDTSALTATERAARGARVAALRTLLASGRIAPADPEHAAHGHQPAEPGAGADAASTDTTPLAQSDLQSMLEVPPASTPPAAAAAAEAGRVLEGSGTGLGSPPPSVAPQRKLRAAQAPAPAQSLFDRLESAPSLAAADEARSQVRSLGRVDELEIAPQYRERAVAEEPAADAEREAAPATPPRQSRKELNVAPDPRGYLGNATELDAVTTTSAATDDDAGATRDAGTPPIRTFESDVDPFRFALLDADHFVLYRKVWQAGRRTIQGALIERGPFLAAMLGQPFASTGLARGSDLLVAWHGDVLDAFRGGDSAYAAHPATPGGSLLQRTRLSAPLGALELLFVARALPSAPGAALLGWLAALLAAVLIGGFALLYRLGLGQIMLARQQQDFVSAVSHELKTPLTSIRMYGEMLREGWVDPDKARTYYDYIHGESERLSRLIDNVLQLARLNRDRLVVRRAKATAGTLVDQVRSKVAAQVERTGFALAVDCAGDTAQAVIDVDADHFAQIVINLVDNALKFAAGAERREVRLGCRVARGTLVVTVRDYGPGVPPDQMKKIFRLFYRPGNELTRETVGTGIGLALVRQLAAAMDGTVDVLNRDPGAEFRVTFPVVDGGKPAA